MLKIVVTGAGSAQSNGVINCLLKDPNIEVIGFGSDQYDLMLCKSHKKYLIPHSKNFNYKDKFLEALKYEKPDILHFQHDAELFVASKFRNEIENLGIKMLMPDNDTIDICVHKYKSWQKFYEAGIKVPKNIVINSDNDLRKAFDSLGDINGRIWIRSMNIGGGGRGSLAVNDFEVAKKWIDKEEGWGSFIAAEILTSASVTWLSIWYEGELIVAQTRKRHSWAHSSLSASGVTGVTKIGETCSSDLVNTVGDSSVRAVSKIPHGIYGVDMTYDKDGVPNPTEINISRFFTTIQFFAEAGLNMPLIFKDLCIGNKINLQKKINPLPDGLLWIRGMDCEPRLTTLEKIKKEIIDFSL